MLPVKGYFLRAKVFGYIMAGVLVMSFAYYIFREFF
jgi:hypothetical protein